MADWMTEDIKTLNIIRAILVEEGFSHIPHPHKNRLYLMLGTPDPSWVVRLDYHRTKLIMTATKDNWFATREIGHSFDLGDPEVFTKIIHVFHHGKTK